MQKIKLIDVETNEEKATFGTCEWCFSIGYVDNPVFVFQTESNEEIKINGYDWNWGDYSEVEIDNIVSFSDWLLNKEYPDDCVFDESWLWDTAQEYQCNRLGV